MLIAPGMCDAENCKLRSCSQRQSSRISVCARWFLELSLFCQSTADVLSIRNWTWDGLSDDGLHVWPREQVASAHDSSLGKLMSNPLTSPALNDPPVPSLWSRIRACGSGGWCGRSHTIRCLTRPSRSQMPGMVEYRSGLVGCRSELGRTGCITTTPIFSRCLAQTDATEVVKPELLAPQVLKERSSRANARRDVAKAAKQRAVRRSREVT